MNAPTILPPPVGVQSIKGWQDGTTGEWYVDKYPLVAVKVEGLKYDALNLDGDWLNYPDVALLLADNTVVCPGECTYDDIGLWLADVKAQAAAYDDGRLLRKKGTT